MTELTKLGIVDIRAARMAAIDAYCAEVYKAAFKATYFPTYIKPKEWPAATFTAIAAAVATANGANWLYSKRELSNFLNLTEQDNG